ncbi:MAG: GatB/YqeY domain-containing protein [Alphaproteobacteria bacterium]
MSLRLKIEENYKNAIKDKNNNEINTLRLIKSAIKDKDIESRTKNKEEGITESEIMSLLQTLIKQRKDSIDSFKQASRDDLIEIEQSEINIISEFLPKQKGEEETKTIIEKIINEKNYETIKDMGKLMGDLKTNYSGSIDMALAGKIAKSRFKV